MNKQDLNQYITGAIQALGNLNMPTTEQNTSIMFAVYQTLHHVQELVMAEEPKSEEKNK